MYEACTQQQALFRIYISNHYDGLNCFELKKRTWNQTFTNAAGNYVHRERAHLIRPVWLGNNRTASSIEAHIMEEYLIAMTVFRLTIVARFFTTKYPHVQFTLRVEARYSKKRHRKDMSCLTIPLSCTSFSTSVKDEKNLYSRSPITRTRVTRIHRSNSN